MIASPNLRAPQSRFLIGIVLITLMTTYSVAQAEEDYRIVKELAFAPHAPSLTLDLYLPQSRLNPPTQKQPTPCVIAIQGGGFLPQSGQGYRSIAEHLSRNGFAVALISYRGRPEHHHHDTLLDVQSSIRFIRQIAGQYNIASQRIGAVGSSAGGTLAALATVTGKTTDPESRIQAAVCFAGVFDFVGRFTKQEQIDLQPQLERKLETNGQWIGSPFSPNDEQWLAASAITHLDPTDPPILFLHARDDATVPWPQSREMHRVMVQQGIAAEIRLYDTGGHGVRPKGEHPKDEMVRFFRKHLYPSDK